MTSRAELFRTLAVFSEPPQAEHERLAGLLGWEPPSGADFAALFVLQAHPYASVHLGDEGMLGGEARDRVAGFWRALQLEPPAEPDHLAALLGLYAALLESEADEPDPARAAMRAEARRALLWEHLLSWAIPFLDAVEACGAPAYRPWARLASSTLLAEARRLGTPDRLPVHLRAASGLPDDRAPLRDWVAALLAPVRSGLILTRADLARAARAMGLGLRIGERAFVLRTLLEQDPTATMRWLVDEADAWAERHARRADELGRVARFWADRARATAARLGDQVAERTTPEAGDLHAARAALEGATLHLWPTGVLYFGSAPRLQVLLLQRIAEHPAAERVVIHLDGLGRIDVTGAVTLRELVIDTERAGLEVELRDVPEQARRIVDRVLASHLVETPADLTTPRSSDTSTTLTDAAGRLTDLRPPRQPGRARCRR